MTTQLKPGSAGFHHTTGTKQACLRLLRQTDNLIIIEKCKFVYLPTFRLKALRLILKVDCLTGYLRNHLHTLVHVSITISDKVLLKILDFSKSRWKRISFTRKGWRYRFRSEALLSSMQDCMKSSLLRQIIVKIPTMFNILYRLWADILF